MERIIITIINQREEHESLTRGEHESISARALRASGLRGSIDDLRLVSSLCSYASSRERKGREKKKGGRGSSALIHRDEEKTSFDVNYRSKR